MIERGRHVCEPPRCAGGFRRADSRDRPIEIQMEELPPGVCGQWRSYADHDVFLIQQGLPAWDRTLAHELGHLMLGHEGISVTDAARESTELVSDDPIS